MNNARAFAHLARERRAQLWHFVFAPNARSSRAIRALLRWRRVPVVQTIASPPRSFERPEQLLFGDVVVAQSAWTRDQLLEHGVTCPVELIHPPLAPITRPSAEAIASMRARLQLNAGEPVVVYPGDLEFSRGASRTASLAEALAAHGFDGSVVFACRRKTERAANAEAELVARLDSRRVRFAGELPSLLPLLALADVVVFPVEDLWAKVDIPIAILEAMALGTPVIVASRGPLSDLSAARRLDADDTANWADTVASLSRDRIEATALVAAQKEMLAERFDARHVAAEYERVYTALLARRGRAI